MAIVKFNSEDGFSVGYNPIDVIDANGNVIANVLNVTTGAALGSVGSITILGGSNGQALTTDGNGNLAFTTISPGGGTPQGPYGALQYNDFGNLNGDANLYYDPILGVLNSPVYSGDAALLSNIPGPLVVGVVPNANYAAFSNLATFSNVANTVSEASQPNITSVGTLTSLSVSGSSNVGDLTGSNIETTNFFIGNGAYLTYVDANVVVGTVANANYAVYSLNTINSNEANSAINVVGSSQPNITAVGSLGNLVVIGNANVDFVEANGMISNSSLLVKGDTTMLGNLIVYGNTIYADVQRLTVKDPIIEMGGNPNGDPLTANDMYDRGSLMHYYTSLPVDAFMGWVSANAEFTVASNVSMVNNAITIHELGNLRADIFYGNGSGLSDLIGSNVIGEVANANYSTYATEAFFAGNITQSFQPNITDLGVLNSLSVAGNIEVSNANLGDLVYGNYFIGDGSNLSSINGSNVTGSVANATFAVTADSANTAATVTTAAQPNITSVGTLTGLSVSGNIDSLNANLGNAAVANFFVGNAINLYDIAGANVTGIVANANYAPYTDFVLTASQPNITSLGILTSLSVVGNIDSGNANLGNATIANYFIGNAINLFGYTAGNIVGIVANAYYADDAGNATNAVNATNAITAEEVSNAAQPNITSLGTLISLSVSGNLTTANADLGNTATANYFVGNGNTLSNIYGPNINGVVANANFAAYTEIANTANSAVIAGTVTTAAQPNITSVGTLTSLSVSGNIDVGNINSAGEISLAGNINASTFIGNFSGNILGNVPAPGNTFEILFNDSGNLSASQALIFNYTSNIATITGDLSVTSNISRDGKLVPTYVVQSGAPTSPVAGDEWYDTDNDRTYQYIFDGVTYQWVDVTSGYINANTSAVANTIALRDIYGNVNANNFNGNNAILDNLTVNVSVIGNVATFTNKVYANGSIVDPNQLATKQYVDQQASTKLQIHSPVKVTTSSSLNATYNNGGEALTITIIASGTTFTTLANHSLSVNDVIVPSSTTNGLTAGVAYFVYSTPTLNTFTLSTTFGGVQATSFTNGTGLSISATGNPGLGATLTNAGTQAALSIDGISLVLTDRVLVRAQSSAFQNGVYTVTTVGDGSTNWVLTRSSDTNKYIPSDINGLGEGDYFYVQSGTNGSGDSYVLTTSGVLILGTTNLTFTLFSAAITYTGVSPITITGQQISLANTTGTGDVVVLSNTPTLITPVLGDASGTTLSLTGNITAANANLGNLVIANYYSGTLTTNAQPNITSVGTLSQLSVSGNITGANLLTNGLISAGGNLTSANINTGVVSASGNITGANILTGGVISATGNITGANANVNGLLTVSGNITGANILTGGLVSITGNLTSGNVNTGIVSASGNITGANILTGGLISSTGNITSGNLTTGIVSTTGNINVGGNISLVGNVTANVITANSLGSKDFRSLRSNVAVTTNTVVDEFAVGTYRTAKYIVQAQGDIGFQSVEVLLVHDNSDSYITIFASVYSNVEVITISSNVVTGNAKLYATASGANTTVNLLSMYVLD